MRSAMLPGMPTRPHGLVTFLFTDIEGSTLVLSTMGAERYADLLATHRGLIRSAVEAHHGHVVDSQGDASFVVFQRPLEDAIAEASAT